MREGDIFKHDGKKVKLILSESKDELVFTEAAKPDLYLPDRKIMKGD